MKPVHIFVGGRELIGYTEMSLQRSKDQLTGSLNVSIFMGYVPNQPVLVDAVHGNPISVYVGGYLVFVGTVDARRDTGDKSGEYGTAQNEPAEAREQGSTSGPLNLSIGPDEYTVQFSARGKAKVLVDSSHQHPTTNFKNTTDKEVTIELLKPWGICVEWLGEVIDLERYRLRDGCVVLDELNRIMREQCHYMYETRDGCLRVTDDIGPTQGEPLILGQNILSFSTEQSEIYAKSEILIKGQRTKRDVWGRDAVDPTHKLIRDEWVTAYIPTIVHHHGDATPEALERRGRFEMNKRSAASKSINLEVFHVQQTNGEPWDIGQIHYVEIPPAGIFGAFECTELTYTVQNDGTLKTSLTLSPPPASGPASGASTSPAGNLLPIESFETLGAGRRAAAGVTYAPGMFPQPWTGPVLSVITPVAVTASAALLSDLSSDMDQPPDRLPEKYESPELPQGRNSR